MALATPFIGTGRGRWSSVPSQSSPFAFVPQPQTVPSSFTASAETSPMESCFTPVSPSTFVGTVAQGVCQPQSPLPSWPFLPEPHSQTVPSASTAPETNLPAAICLTLCRPAIASGVTFSLLSPVPTPQSSWVPQARTVPSRFRSSTCLSPTAASTTSLTPERSVGSLTAGLCFGPAPREGEPDILSGSPQVFTVPSTSTRTWTVSLPAMTGSRLGGWACIVPPTARPTSANPRAKFFISPPSSCVMCRRDAGEGTRRAETEERREASRWGRLLQMRRIGRVKRDLAASRCTRHREAGWRAPHSIDTGAGSALLNVGCERLHAADSPLLFGLAPVPAVFPRS